MNAGVLQLLDCERERRRLADAVVQADGFIASVRELVDTHEVCFRAGNAHGCTLLVELMEKLREVGR